jgi:hypothetical protein
MSVATLGQEAAIVRIRREIAESEKRTADREKLYEEAAKFGRERWLAPIIAIRGLIVGALGILVALAAIFLRPH